MGRRSTARVMNVFALEQLMGELKSTSGGAMEFRYSNSWLSAPGSFPLSLSVPLGERPYRNAELEPFLDNLLPDEEGVRRAIATRVGAQGTDPFSLLWELGRDCVGALQFLPAGVAPASQRHPDGPVLTDGEVAEILRSLATSPLGVTRTAEFRISVAGAQEKTALLRTSEGWVRPTGTTPSSHIIKPPIGMSGPVDLSASVENEYLCMLIVAELGLPTATVEIARFEDVTALVVERFDRAWRGPLPVRLPQEDLCQALGVPSFRKYDANGGPGMLDVLALLLQSDAPEEDRRQFLQSCFAYWVLGATDGHAKNFSLALGAQGGFRLSPLYDVLSLQPSVDAHQVSRREFRVAMAVGNGRHYKVDEIMPRHFVQTAVAAGVDQGVATLWMQEINERVPGALQRAAEAMDESVPQDLLGSIADGALRRAELLA
jgi:serine/threonine-protein kinase HipA